MSLEAILVIVGFVGLVVWINMTLWDIWKNKKIKNQSLDIIIKAARQLKNPLSNQLSDYEELSRRVSDLHKTDQGDSEPSDQI